MSNSNHSITAILTAINVVITALYVLAKHILISNTFGNPTGFLIPIRNYFLNLVLSHHVWLIILSFLITLWCAIYMLDVIFYITRTYTKHDIRIIGIYIIVNVIALIIIL